LDSTVWAAAVELVGLSLSKWASWSTSQPALAVLPEPEMPLGEKSELITKITLPELTEQRKFDLGLGF
jgi:hypothetical protein